MIKEQHEFLKRYLKLAKVNKLYMFITVFTAIIYKSFEIIMALCASLIIKYATIHDIKMTWISLGLLVFSYIIYIVSLYFNYHIYGKNMKHCYTNLQKRLLNKLISVDDNFTKQISRGKLINSINSDVIDIGDMLDIVSELITSIIQIIIIYIILLNYGIYLTVIMFIYSITYILFRNYYSKLSALYLKKAKLQDDNYSNLLSQTLSGLQEIKTFNMLSSIKEKLDVIKFKFSDSYLKRRKYLNRRDNDCKFITHGFRIVFYVALIFMIKGSITTIDVLVLIIAYHDTVILALDTLIDCMNTLREVTISVDRINSILEYKVSDEIIYGVHNNDDITGIIEFKNVSFAYKDKNIINNLSFKIKPNSITAIVGQSGTGKTSIINLLLRLYKVDKGHILIDGVDIYDYSKEIYSRNVAVVNQRPFIFNMSIRDNLDFIDTSPENQVEACKRVGIHDFIMSLPSGYDTVLRENALNVSGGQKQLISIARTLLSKAEILLFDEITSSLDPDTTKHIDRLLKELTKDHTIVMITHKPDVMKKADRIIVIHNGRIVGDGAHNQLIKNNENYKWLQAKKSASKVGVFD